MRFLRIFLLHFQLVVTVRGRAFVWFLVAVINPLVSLVFWTAVLREKGNILEGWELSSITSYYFLLIIAGSVLIAHIEEDVAVYDIKEGGLVSYLMRPLSYIKMKFFDESPWRMMQLLFGVAIFLIFSLFLGNFVTFATGSLLIVAILIAVLAFLISFTLKMIIGLSAFWLTDFWGFQQLIEVTSVVLAGFVIPVDLLPNFLKTIALTTPFPYTVYYPIVALQGKLNFGEAVNVIFLQLFWLAALYLIYQILWLKGLKKFTGVGQ